MGERLNQRRHSAARPQQSTSAPRAAMEEVAATGRVSAGPAAAAIAAGGGGGGSGTTCGSALAEALGLMLRVVREEAGAELLLGSQVALRVRE